MPKFISHLGKAIALAVLVTVFLFNLGSLSSAQEPKAKEGDAKAEDGDEAKKPDAKEVAKRRDAVLAAFKALDKIAIGIKALESDVAEKRNAITSDGSKEGDAKAKKARTDLLQAYLKKKIEFTKAFTEAQTTYVEAFEKTEITSWDVANEELDARVLQTGCLMMIRHYEAENDMDKVVTANYWLLKFARTRDLKLQGLRALPKLLPLMKNGKQAIAIVHEVYDLKEPKQALTAKVLITEINTTQGQYEAARKGWKELFENELKSPKKASYEGQTKAYGELMVKHLGKSAPKLKTVKWVGARKRSLRGLRPKIVVLNFFATVFPASLQEVPLFHQMAEAYKDHDVQVLGCTQLLADGIVPTNLEQLSTGKGKLKTYKNMNAEQSEAHLKEFRKNTKLAYPFALLSPAEMKRFRAEQVPLSYVVDHKGVVAYIGEANRANHIARVVERLIEVRAGERKAKEAAKKKAEGK